MNAQPTPLSPTASNAGVAASASANQQIDKAPEPRKYNFGLSTRATRMLFENLGKRGTPNATLRVGVRGGGCSGFSYVLEFEDKPPRSRDLVFAFTVERKESDAEEPGEVRVICDKKSIVYLNGSSLDWEKTLMYRGFKFVNPQESSSCGCNSSFAI